MHIEEIIKFDHVEWKKCINILKENWNTDYGSITETKNQEGETILELITGGWAENEKIIYQIQDTMFWFMYWQESKRGGYYKFKGKEILND